VSTDSPPKHARTSTSGQRAIIGGAIVLFAVLAAYLALVIITRVDSIFLPPGHQITLGPVGGVLPGVDSGGTSGSQERLNILVMGLDRRAREGDIPTRTDSLFVVTVDPKTGTTGILGIPRDLWVNIPGKGGGSYKDRINTVYVAGENGHYAGGGVGLLKQVLAADPFNIKIDRYVIIDLKGFESIIDDLGGIDVDVPDEVYDPYYSETELPGDYFPVHVLPGIQHMDGEHALAYARVRFSSDDLDRIQRQQRVIFAAIAKAKSLDVLKNAKSLWENYKDTVKTDISDYEIPKYALLANDVKDNIQAVSLGPATAPYTTAAGAEVLVGNTELIHQIVDSLFSDKPSDVAAQPSATPEPVRVEVQNGTGTEGLANGVVRYIIGRGYPANDLSAANATDGQSHSASEIIDVTGKNHNNAYILANWLNIPISRVRDATDAERSAMGSNSSEIVVVLGSDVDFTQLTTSPTTETPGG
jgi:LCP family protein required for cell wall assembly